MKIANKSVKKHGKVFIMAAMLAIPVTGREGPQGCKTSRHPDFL
jgi:hypothetical protein